MAISTEGNVFSPNDTIKLQFRCERPGGGGIDVSGLVRASELGLTGDASDTPVQLTAQFNTQAVADALAAAASASTPQERLALLAEANRIEGEYKIALAEQLQEGAESQGESIARAVVDYLVGGNLIGEDGEPIEFSREDGSRYVVRESELNVSARRTVQGEDGEEHGFFIVSATATWG